MVLFGSESSGVDDRGIVIVGGTRNFAALFPSAASSSFFPVLWDVFAVPLSSTPPVASFRFFVFVDLLFVASLDASEQDASDASAAIAAEASAPNGSFITSVGDMYMRS